MFKLPHGSRSPTSFKLLVLFTPYKRQINCSVFRKLFSVSSSPNAFDQYLPSCKHCMARDVRCRIATRYYMERYKNWYVWRYMIHYFVYWNVFSIFTCPCLHPQLIVFHFVKVLYQEYKDIRVMS